MKKTAQSQKAQRQEPGGFEISNALPASGGFVDLTAIKAIAEKLKCTKAEAARYFQSALLSGAVREIGQIGLAKTVTAYQLSE